VPLFFTSYVNIAFEFHILGVGGGMTPEPGVPRLLPAEDQGVQSQGISPSVCDAPPDQHHYGMMKHRTA